ncbi:hypothetical protein QGN32_17380 [Mycolicibacterium sp. ND9-15]|nr:hypothetical protein [Mycolicibacterium sp. ND9-15]WSE55205.1 hypothetical protein QGN32_17380 [Mycolicibacterium sp. ND9-15]
MAGLISDAHVTKHALEAVLYAVWCLGDVVGYVSSLGKTGA